MRNIKIEINEQGGSTLDEIVEELERLGYERTYYAQNTSGKWIKTCDVRKCELTTLAELKELQMIYSIITAFILMNIVLFSTVCIFGSHYEN